MAGEKSVSELRQTAQAGGSLIVDMRHRRYIAASGFGSAGNTVDSTAE